MCDILLALHFMLFMLAEPPGLSHFYRVDVRLIGKQRNKCESVIRNRDLHPSFFGSNILNDDEIVNIR